MSAIGAVIENFEEAQKCETELNYLRAARFYRLCALYYENGELPVYNSQVEEYGSSALSRYEYCKEKLVNKTRKQLDAEEAKYINGSYFISKWTGMSTELCHA